MTLSRKPLRGMKQLEPLELFLAKSGSELSVEHSYNFTDKSGRKLIMRQEITPYMSRMVAASGELIYPVKCMSFPVCYRYERSQCGRIFFFGRGMKV